MTCKCQGCDNSYYIDVVVSDAIWETIKPSGKPLGGGLLCGSCIFERLEFKLNGYHSFDSNKQDSKTGARFVIRRVK